MKFLAKTNNQRVFLVFYFCFWFWSIFPVCQFMNLFIFWRTFTCYFLVLFFFIGSIKLP